MEKESLPPIKPRFSEVCQMYNFDYQAMQEIANKASVPKQTHRYISWHQGQSSGYEQIYLSWNAFPAVTIRLTSTELTNGNGT